MIYINLLPIKEIRERERAYHQLLAFAVGFLCLLLVLGGVGVFQATTAAQLNADLSRLQNEKHKYTRILNQIKKFEQDRALTEKKIAVIEELKKSSALTVHILDEVARLTPTKRLWLKSLAQTGNKLQLTGMALDNRTIAQYMDDLKTSPYINEVSLQNSTLAKYAGRDLKSFAISCLVSVPDKTPGKTDKISATKQ
ncbi:fimbrial assembly protein (PilN) [bacterium BMS3Bbin14]|nr:fimbrial assembly protein (PilN) [bacterium BMS3Bbin14]HDL98243.1 pilus assembly protein PilN [Desulfobacteraceae bacterium]HDO30984.1 pilus assembly protein PilN [Desulfobacteraceae bacterium]